MNVVEQIIFNEENSQISPTICDILWVGILVLQDQLQAEKFVLATESGKFLPRSIYPVCRSNITNLST